jgi:hypothetical protein
VHHRIRTQPCPFADLIIVVFENPDPPATSNSPYWEYPHRLPPTRLRRPQRGRSSAIYHGDRAAAFLPHYPPVPTGSNDRDPVTRPPRTDRRTHGCPAARGGRGSAGSGSGRVRLEKQIIAAGALLMRDNLSILYPPRRMSGVPRVSAKTLPPRPPTGWVAPQAPAIDDEAPVRCESGTRPEHIEIPHKDLNRSTPAGQLDIRHFPPPPTAPHPHRRPEPRSLP